MPHKYIPNQESERKTMLDKIGLNSEDELFSCIPEGVKFKRELALEKKSNEIEVTKRLKHLASENVDTCTHISFIGAGVYDHHVPSVIDPIVSRSEFYTSYTPYQPEISQGTLQSIFEYQTAICNLTNMDISNASMYDGASALYEACSLSISHKKINRIILFSSIHPEYIEVVKTGLAPHKTRIELAFDMDSLLSLLSEPCACIALQSPDFYGNIQDIERLTKLAKEHGCLSIFSVDPISLGLLEPPGSYGADIVVGDGQPLGCYMNLGGPHFGFFCTSKDLMRKIPGRIVGKTTDIDGKDGYVLTLQAREQHIRREKASSNICSNHSLCALRGLIYLSVVGREGLFQIASDCAAKAQYLKEALIHTGFFEEARKGPIFKEFALKSKLDISLLNDKLFNRGFIGGLHLKKEDYWLLAVTEKRTYKELDDFIGEVERICKENH